MAIVCQCGHPTVDHDRIAARYCAATVRGHLSRGCVCVAEQPAPLDRLTGRGRIQ